MLNFQLTQERRRHIQAVKKRRLFYLSVFVIISLVCKGEIVSFNGIVYEVINDDELMITSCSLDATEVAVLPEVRIGNKDYVTVAIAPFAFKNHFLLQSLSIPNTVTFIGYEAFADCENLQRLVLPDDAVVQLTTQANNGKSNSVKKSPLNRCKALSELRGNNIPWPEYFTRDLTVGKGVSDLPVFRKRNLAQSDNIKKKDDSKSLSKKEKSGIISSSYTSNKTSADISKEEELLKDALSGKSKPENKEVSSVSSTKKVSQKAIKSLADYGKTVSGVYNGAGALFSGNEIIEQYDFITIEITRIDRHNVSVNVFENGSIPFFEEPVPYSVERGDKGYVLKNLEIGSALIKINEGESLFFTHPRINIDGDLYKLNILVTDGGLSFTDNNKNNVSGASRGDAGQLTVKMHNVSFGETLDAIAKKYKVTVEMIKEWNELSSKSVGSTKLPPGTQLMIWIK